MSNFKDKLRSQITKHGQHDGYWVRKFNSLLIGGNGAALILLGSFMSKSADPIQQLQDNRVYFLPFLLGIVCAALATIAGARAERTLLSLNLTLEEGDELGIARDQPPGEYKRDAEMRYYKARYTYERFLSTSHFVSVVCFLSGLGIIAVI